MKEEMIKLARIIDDCQYELTRREADTTYIFNTLNEIKEKIKNKVKEM